jgi:hypothetical protein
MKLPKKLYVKMEKEGDVVYPIPVEAIPDLAEIGEKIRIGIYELVDTAFVECEVKTRIVGRKE